MYKKNKCAVPAPQYWSMTGHDIWQLNNPVCELKNLITGEVMQLNVSIPVRFKPVIMPKIKKEQKKTAKKKKERKKSVEKTKKDKGPTVKKRRKSSKYRGVTSASKGKFRVQYWDPVLGKNVGLGTFDSELLAAAAYQKRKGNHKEATRLLDKYHEEVGWKKERPVVNSMIPGDFEGA